MQAGIHLQAQLCVQQVLCQHFSEERIISRAFSLQITTVFPGSQCLGFLVIDSSESGIYKQNVDNPANLMDRLTLQVQQINTELLRSSRTCNQKCIFRKTWVVTFFTCISDPKLKFVVEIGISLILLSNWLSLLRVQFHIPVSVENCNFSSHKLKSRGRNTMYIKFDSIWLNSFLYNRTPSISLYFMATLYFKIKGIFKIYLYSEKPNVRLN